MLRFTTTSSVISQSNSQSQSVIGNEFGSNNKEDKSKTVHAIYSIMESALEVAKKQNHGSVDLTDEYFGSNCTAGIEIFHPFLPLVTDILIDSIAQLKEPHPALVVGKVLGFVSKLLSHELPLSMLIQSNNGVALFSALKRMLFGHADVIKQQTISVLISIFSTYETAMEVPGEHQRHIVDLPSTMQQVDLIHAISDVMNTSDPTLFQLILQLLKRWIEIPLLRGKMSDVVETGLRIVSVVINSKSIGIDNISSFFQSVFENMETVPVSMQNQIISLYSKLPCNWKPAQYLQWANLLLFCSESKFHPSLNNFLTIALTSLKENPCCVTSLKLFLAISQSIRNCNRWPDFNETQSDETELYDSNKLLSFLISIQCIPSVMAMLKFGKASDSIYVVILLQLLFSYPLERLVPPTQVLDDSEPPQMFTVEFADDNEDDEDTSGINRLDMYLMVKGLYCKKDLWTAEAYMKILAWTRCNIELLKHKKVFDIWNENLSRIVCERHSIYLAPLAGVWHQLSPDKDVEDRFGFVLHAFRNVELDIYKWVDVMGRDLVQNSEIDPDLKLQHEAILVFYYFYFLFNMNDNEQFLSPEFLPILTKQLDQMLQNKKSYLPSDWECLSFYFKVSLFLASCANDFSTVNMIELFEAFILDVEEAMPNFEQLVTYSSKVFNLLLRWNILPMTDVAHLLEKWAVEDLQDFQHFFRTIKLSDEHEATLRNHIVAITGYGSIETSNFMVGVVEERKIQQTANFDAELLHSTLITLQKEILYSNQEKSKITNRQFNFSNVLKLALGDSPLFCLERPIPSEFFEDVVKILLKYRSISSIAEVCLRFLLNFISSIDNTGFVRNICLGNGLVRFLGERLQLKRGHPMINSLAFELMAILVNVVDTDAEKSELRREKPVRWCMSSIFPYMQYCVSMISFLELICTLLRKDFNHCLVKVKERKLRPTEFINLLLNLQFHAQSLLHKDIEANSELVWKFLYELLCFSGRGFSGKVFSANVIMHPWNHLTISTCVLSQPNPFCLPVQCLQFLVKWTDYYYNLMIQNPINFPLEYQAFCTINQFYQLRDFFSSGSQKYRSSVSHTPCEENMQFEDANFDTWTFSFGHGTASSEEPLKLELVDQISATCNLFLRNSPQLSSKTDDEEEVGSIGFDEMSSISCYSGCSTSTCSSSEFDFELSPRA